MISGFASQKFAPLSPKIRTKTDRHLIQVSPNFWGEGLGVRGKPVLTKRVSIRNKLRELSKKRNQNFSLLTPNPLLLLNSEHAGFG